MKTEPSGLTAFFVKKFNRIASMPLLIPWILFPYIASASGPSADEIVGVGLVLMVVSILLSVLISYIIKRIVSKNLTGILLVGIFDILLLVAIWSVLNISQGVGTNYGGLLEIMFLIITYFAPVAILLFGGSFLIYTLFYFWYRRSHPEFSYSQNTFFIAMMGILLTLLMMGGLGLSDLLFSGNGMLCEFVASKDRCYENKAERLPRKEWCAKIRDDVTRNTCYQGVAYKTQNSELCNKISFEHMRVSCNSYFDNLK